MGTTDRRILFWAPRVLCAAFVAFLGLLSLDVFGLGYGTGEALLAFVIHLIPALLVLAILWLSWRREWIVTAAFLVLGGLHAADSWGTQHWSAIAIISGSLTAMAGLFAVNWIYRDRIRPR